MPGSNYLLDTNIVIEVFSGNQEVADRISDLEGFFISATVLGELYVGVNRVANKIKHQKKLLNFLRLCEVILIDTATSEKFGELSAYLYKKGKPIPSNDIWIAASAIQHNLILITMDKHFQEIEGLAIDNWK